MSRWLDDKTGVVVKVEGDARIMAIRYGGRALRQLDDQDLALDVLSAPDFSAGDPTLQGQETSNQESALGGVSASDMSGGVPEGDDGVPGAEISSSAKERPVDRMTFDQKVAWGDHPPIQAPRTSNQDSVPKEDA